MAKRDNVDKVFAVLEAIGKVVAGSLTAIGWLQIWIAIAVYFGLLALLAGLLAWGAFCLYVLVIAYFLVGASYVVVYSYSYPALFVSGEILGAVLLVYLTFKWRKA
jgi:hypothetical protein